MYPFVIIVQKTVEYYQSVQIIVINFASSTKALFYIRSYDIVNPVEDRQNTINNKDCNHGHDKVYKFLHSNDTMKY